MNKYDELLTLFEHEARQASISFQAVDLDPFVRKAAFALKVAPPVQAIAEGMMPTASLPPQISDAVLLATQFRDAFGANDLDPLYELPALADRILGITVFVIEERRISGACAMLEGRPFIFVSAFAGIDALYVCARQVGHLLLLPARKKAVAMELAHEPSHAPRGPYKRFADYFALELLVPTRGLTTALGEIRKLLDVTHPSIGDIELLYLSRIFGLSFLSIARRCERAVLLPSGGATAFYQALLDAHGGPEKRANAAMLPPRPEVTIPRISQSLAMQTGKHIRSGRLSLEEAKHELDLPMTNLEQILKLH